MHFFLAVLVMSVIAQPKSRFKIKSELQEIDLCGREFVIESAAEKYSKLEISNTWYYIWGSVLYMSKSDEVTPKHVSFQLKNAWILKMRILETSIEFIYEQILFFKFWKFVCDQSDGKYFIENIADGTRLFLEGEFEETTKTNPRYVGVTSDDKNFSQVG